MSEPFLPSRTRITGPKIIPPPGLYVMQNTIHLYCEMSSLERKSRRTRFSISFDTKGNFSYIGSDAGVVKLVDARDSKSRGASTPCRFDSDLRHQLFSKELPYAALNSSLGFKQILNTLV